MSLYYAIDLFEDNGWVVFERSDGETFNIPREWIPEDAQGGDVLSIDAASEGKASLELHCRHHGDRQAQRGRLRTP